MNKILLYCGIVFLSVSCTVYQNTSVSFDRAVDAGKVKVVTISGGDVLFKSIHRSDSGYVGLIGDSLKILINENQVRSIFLEDLTPSHLKKNIVYLGFATINWSLCYERIIFDRVGHSFLVKASGGSYVLPFDSEGPQFSLQGIGLVNNGAKHFEFAFGIVSRFDKTNYSFAPSNATKMEYIDWLPAINIGFRYQEPGGHLIIRTGVGFPEFVYFSFGVAF